MKKTLNAALAILVGAGSLLATTTPADAEGRWGNGWGRGEHWGHHDDDLGVALAGGVIGLALGAALSSHDYSYHEPRRVYYAPPPPYVEGPYPYRTCYARHRYWDEDDDEYIVRTTPYPC